MEARLAVTQKQRDYIILITITIGVVIIAKLTSIAREVTPGQVGQRWLEWFMEHDLNWWLPGCKQ